ncbi:MAG: hypothetical protein ABW042_10465 [Phenylobacterium sp.]
MFEGFCRLARESELTAIAELRFTHERPGAPASEKALFVDDFLRLAAGRPGGGILHWVLDRGGTIIATRAVVIFRRLPEPGALQARGAWVSPCYRAPGVRCDAAAARLLSAIEDWAGREGVELSLSDEPRGSDRRAA